MMKIFKKKRFWIILAVILVLAGFGLFKLFTAKPQVQYSTEAVKRGKLTQTVSATGNIESANEINLNFRSAGKIVSQTVKEGDDVKAGQELARLDTSSVGAMARQYQASVAAARANLEKVRAGASSEDVNLTQQQVIKSQNDLDSLKTDAADQIKAYKEGAVNSLNSAVFVSQTALNAIYNNLINSETTYNLQFKDTSLQNKVKNNYGPLKDQLTSLQSQVADINSNKNDYDKIVSGLDAVRNHLLQLNDFLKDSYNLSDAIIINNSYSQTSKDTIKSTVSTQQSAESTALTSVQTAKSTLVNGKNSYESQIQAAENALSISKAQLDLKKAGPRSFDVQSAQASLAQAEAQLSKLMADLEDYSIKAPIDGKITKVNYSVGESPDASKPVMVMLGTERYEIKVDIPESDVTKIKVGNKVSISLDAFGSDHLFSGSITFIDPAQTVIKDVIYYKTTISFDQDSWNEQIKPGMTASITIMSDSKDNVLFIPQRAVKIKETVLGEVAKKYVEVLINNQPQEREVTVGLRGDNGLVEILSGLSEGDQVITFKK